MIILKNEENEVLEKFTRTQFNNQQALRERIYARKNEEKGVLECACQKEPVPITVAKISKTDTIYLKNVRKGGADHAISCRMRDDYEKTHVTEKGWQEIDEDIVEVSLSASAFSFTEKSKIKSEEKTHDVIDDGLVLRSKRNPSRYKVGLLGLLMRFSLMVSEDLSKKESYQKTEQKTILDYNRQAFGTSRKIQVANKKRTLQDMWFNYWNTKSAMTGDVLFYFGQFDSYKWYNEHEPNLSLHAKFQEGKGFLDNIKCKKEMLDEALKQIQIQELSPIKEEGKYEILVGGFVQKGANGYWSFNSFALLPINEYGMWTESTYEKEVFNALTGANIPFYKPYEGLEEYNNLKPDIVFLNPKNEGITYVGEVFGMENDKDYDRIKSEKIAWDEQSDLIDLWYVTAKNGKLETPWPEIYPKE